MTTIEVRTPTRDEYFSGEDLDWGTDDGKLIITSDDGNLAEFDEGQWMYVKRVNFENVETQTV